jgi:predicted TIM-barrel fold metal-dependent hydrolase
MSGAGLAEAYRDRVIDWAEQSELDAVGLLGMDGVYTQEGELDESRTVMKVGADYLFEVCGQSDKLKPIPSINPRRADAVEHLHDVAERGAVAIKTLPNSQGFDPSNPDFESFWQAMAELELPLLSHTSFEHTIPVVDQAYGEPARLEAPLEAGVTVIAAHCASSGVAHVTDHFQTWREMIEEHRHLYGDISAMASMARFSYLRRVLGDPVSRRRAVYGSDCPIPVTPWLFAASLGLGEVRRLGDIQNPLDRNLQTVRAVASEDDIDIGDVLTRASRLLGL